MTSGSLDFLSESCLVIAETRFEKDIMVLDLNGNQATYKLHCEILSSLPSACSLQAVWLAFDSFNKLSSSVQGISLLHNMKILPEGDGVIRVASLSFIYFFNFLMWAAISFAYNLGVIFLYLHLL